MDPFGRCSKLLYMDCCSAILLSKDRKSLLVINESSVLSIQAICFVCIAYYSPKLFGELAIIVL